MTNLLNKEEITTWRLLPYEVNRGALNMAIDEAIMQNVARKTALPTLRFYGWSPACLSLGYTQRARQEVNLVELDNKGFDLVRRPTGGRSILHDHELTYSVSAPVEDERVSGKVSVSYRKISAALISGLADLAIKAEMASPSAAPVRDDQGKLEQAASAACFDTPSDYEVTIAGRKLIGSAQTRRDGALLQHGTILLEVDVPALFDLLHLPSGRDRQATLNHTRERLVALKEITDQQLDPPLLAQALATAFSRIMKINLVPGKLSDSEEELSLKLAREKYNNKDWTFKR